jgi:hypothetical protein
VLVVSSSRWWRPFPHKTSFQAQAFEAGFALDYPEFEMPFTKTLYDVMVAHLAVELSLPLLNTLSHCVWDLPHKAKWRFQHFELHVAMCSHANMFDPEETDT